MKDENKTREQLVDELAESRPRMAGLEASEAERTRAESQRDATLEALRKSEDQFRLITDAVPVLISYVDSEQRYRFNNKTHEEWFGHPRTEVYGAHIREVLGEQAYRSISKYIEAVLSGQEVTFESTVPYKDAGMRHVQATYVPHFGEQGYVKGFVALVSDITERKKLEAAEKLHREALRETRDYLESLMNYANAPIIVWDPGERITRFNTAFEHLTGYPVDEVIGQELYMLFPETSRAESLGKIARTLSGEYWESVEIPILCKDGETRLVLWNSANIYAEDGTTLVATIAQGTDITERKHAEGQLRDYSERLEEIVEERTQELREREQWLSTTLRSIGAAVIATDAQGVVTLVNLVAEDLTGWDTVEAVGKPLEDIFSIVNEQTGERVESPVARVLREGVVVGLANPTLLIARDGTKRPISDSGAPMQDEAGKIIGTVLVFRDITARRRAEVALERRVAELSALSAMASIVNESLDVDEILNRTMDEALRLVGVEAAAMMLLDEEAGELVMTAHRGTSDEFVRAFDRMKLGEGLSGQVAQTGEPAVLSDLADYPEARRSYLDSEKIRSAAAVPLMGRTGVFGTMSLGATSPEYFDAEGLELLVGLGQQIAIGVEKARLYQRERAAATAAAAAQSAMDTVEAMGDGLILHTMAGEVTFVNPALERMTGYEKSELMGSAADLAQRLVKPEDLEKTMGAMQAALQGTVPEPIPFTILSREGQEVPATVTVSFIQDVEGKPTSTIVVFKDITALGKTEEALAQRVQELDRFNRLAAGRELRMIELKRQINELSEQLGQEPPYDLSILEG